MTKYYTFTCVILWYWCPDDVNFCSCWVGLMIFRNNQNIENIQKMKRICLHQCSELIDLPFLFQWHYYWDDYNAMWVPICGLTSLFEHFNITNLTPCTVMNWWNLRLANTLQHRWRLNSIVWNCQLKTVLVENFVNKTIWGSTLELSWEFCGSSWCWELGWFGM